MKVCHMMIINLKHTFKRRTKELSLYSVLCLVMAVVSKQYSLYLNFILCLKRERERESNEVLAGDLAAAEAAEFSV